MPSPNGLKHLHHILDWHPGGKPCVHSSPPNRRPVLFSRLLTVQSR